jgi:NADPH:quinone reductase-like Zn-dependent oxidoreductase
MSLNCDDSDRGPGPSDVVVRMEAAAVNPSDFMLIRGQYFVRPELPATAGSEGVGIVIDVGEQADSQLVGKRVLVLPT